MDNLLSTYIQKGVANKKDLFATWGFLLKTAKLINVPKLKEPNKRSWLDEQGDDEYLPDNPTYDAYTVDIEFAFIGEKDTFQTQLRSFWNYIQGTEFNIFDVFYKAGIRCRFNSYDETYKQRRNSDIFTFKMNFKVNQPLCQGFYIPGTSIARTSGVDGIAYFSDGVKSTFTKGSLVTRNFSTTDNFVIIVPNTIGDIFTD